MIQFVGRRRRFTVISLGMMLMGCIPASGAITYSCASNIDATFAGTCNTLNTTIAGIYGSTFTNANASIYITYGSTGLASSLQFLDNVTYTAYANALAAHEGDANDATAVGSLGGNVTNPVAGGNGVTLTGTLAAALGLSGGIGITTSSASCTLGTLGCYNGIVTLTSAANTFYYRQGGSHSTLYDFFTAVEHETDEVLGTGSCINGVGTLGVGCTNGSPSTAVSAPDLFRWASAGTRSDKNSANGSTAYFSINSGTTNIAGYNNSPGGADYGDWDGASGRVQNAFGTPGAASVDITNDGGSEISVLDAVGYNLQSPVPEPATIGLVGVLLLGGLAYRRRRA